MKSTTILALTLLGLFAATPSHAAGLPLFTEDFSTPGLLVEKWKLAGPKNWEIKDGALVADGGGVRSAVPNVTHGGPVEIKLRVKVQELGDGGAWTGFGVRGVTFMLVPHAVGYAYRVEGQPRSNGGRSANVNVEAGKWYEFRVVQRGELYECFVDGSRVFEFRESNPIINRDQLFALVTSKPPTAYDDVSINVLSEADAKVSPNLLRNASFETVPDTVPLYWKPWGLPLVPLETFWKNWRVDKDPAHAFDGKQSLCLTNTDVKPNAGFFSAANGVAVTIGKPSTFSIQLKADRPEFKAQMVFYEIGSGKMTRQDIIVGTAWQRYVFTHPGVALAQISVGVTALSIGTLWADAAQLETGDKATPFALSTFENEDATPAIKLADLPAPPMNPPPARADGSTNGIDRARRCLMVDGHPWLAVAPLIELNHAETEKSVATIINHFADAGFRTVNVVSKMDQPTSAAIWGYVFAQCAARDLKLIVWPARSRGAAPNYQDFIARWRDQPSLIAWLPVDEPEISSQTPEDVIAIMDQFKQGDPKHPAFVNYTVMGIPGRYAGLPGDILSIDDYLTNRPNRQVREIVQQVDVMEKVGRELHKPTWLFIVGNNLHNHFREPSAAEQVAQSYGCVVAGANGLMYFMGAAANRNHWQALCQTNRELLSLAEVIYSPEPTPAVTCSSNAIRWMARRVGSQLYLITVNLEAQPVDVTFTIPGTEANKPATVLFEDRTQPLAGDKLTQTFAPHERHVFRIDLAASLKR